MADRGRLDPNADVHASSYTLPLSDVQPRATVAAAGEPSTTAAAAQFMEITTAPAGPGELISPHALTGIRSWPGRFNHLRGLEQLRLVDQLLGMRDDVLGVLAEFEAETARSLPELAGQVRALRADLERAVAIKGRHALLRTPESGVEGARVAWCVCGEERRAEKLGDAHTAVLDHVAQADSGQVPAHAWREFNEHGNTCHFPGCTRNEDEHHGDVNEEAQ